MAAALRAAGPPLERRAAPGLASRVERAPTRPLLCAPSPRPAGAGGARASLARPPSLGRDVPSSRAPVPHRRRNCTLELQGSRLAQPPSERGGAESGSVNLARPTRRTVGTRGVRTLRRLQPRARSRPRSWALPALCLALSVLCPYVCVSSRAWDPRPCVSEASERGGRSGTHFLGLQKPDGPPWPASVPCLEISSDVSGALCRPPEDMMAPFPGRLLCPWAPVARTS